MSLGKKIITIVLAVLLVAGIGVGIWFGVKGSGVSEEDAKLSVTDTTQFIEETVGSFYKKSIESVSGSISGSLTSSQNLLLENTVDVEIDTYNLGYLVENLMVPTSVMIIADYLMRNDELSFGQQLYGPWSSDDEVYYLHLVRQDEGFTLSITVPFEDGNTELVINVKYDYENKKPISIELVCRDTGELGYFDFMSINLEKGDFYSLTLSNSILPKLLDNSASITNDNIADYYCYDMSACYAEVDYEDFNLSRFDGFVLDYGDDERNFVSDNVNLSNLQKNLYRESLQRFINSFPTEESMKPSVDMDNSKISYLVEDAYNLAEERLRMNNGVDANGNTYYFTRFEECDTVKNHVSQISSMANNTKPLYGEQTYNAEGFEGTSEISITHFKGLVNGISTLLNSKNANNYAGIKNETYGNYTFSLFTNVSANYYNEMEESPIFKELINDKELRYYTAVMEDLNSNYIVNRIYATCEGQWDSYLYLTYIVDDEDNVIYINFREYEPRFMTSWLTFFEYANTESNKAVIYGNYIISDYKLDFSSFPYEFFGDLAQVERVESIEYMEEGFEDNYADYTYTESFYDSATSEHNILETIIVDPDMTVAETSDFTIEILEDPFGSKESNFYLPFGTSFRYLVSGIGHWY